MSARKSWDIAPAPKRTAAAPRSAPAPAARSAPRTAPRPAEVPPRRAAPTRRPPVPTAPLAERRRGARRARLKAIGVVCALLAGALIGLSWLPALRISSVAVRGADPDRIAAIVDRETAGTYAFLMPRSSIFLYPRAQIEEAILASHPHLERVALARTSFSEISIDATERPPVFVWCGPDHATATPCYFGDRDGLLFAPVPEGASSSPRLPQIAAPLAAADQLEPVGQRLAASDGIAGVVAMVTAIEALELPVAKTAIRGDEVDIMLENATRIVYLLGQEREAAAVAASSLPGLNLLAGGYAYVDLRFDGKAYAMPRTSTP